METELEVVEGYAIWQVIYLSQYMVTDNENGGRQKIHTFWSLTRKDFKYQEILPLLESILQSNRPLLIIADDVDGNSSTLVLNKIRGTFNIVSGTRIEIAAKPC